MAPGPGKESRATNTPRRPRYDTPSALHLFSGPTDRPDGIRAILERVGWGCWDVDIVNVGTGFGPAQHDLASEAAWRMYTEWVLQGTFDFVIMGTPCTTFSAVRRGPPGPRPLRSADHPYGFPKKSLTPKEWEEVRLGNYFAIKSAELATVCRSVGVGFAIENPQPQRGHPSIFILDEFVTLSSLADVRAIDFDQCRWGAETAKPTRILYWGVDLRRLEGRCNHPPKLQTWITLRGEQASAYRPHPPLAGRLRPSGEWATKAAAAYPEALNRAIAHAAVDRGRRSLPPSGARMPGAEAAE